MKCAKTAATETSHTKAVKIISQGGSHQFVSWLDREAIVAADPSAPPPATSPDPGNDYLLALAAREQAMLVSHEQHLLSLRDRHPVRTPNEFVKLISTDTYRRGRLWEAWRHANCCSTPMCLIRNCEVLRFTGLADCGGEAQKSPGHARAA